jgi:hypothetical protein
MRSLITFLLVGLLTMLGSTTYAQDIPRIYCGDLSEADCQLLNGALAHLPQIQSAQIELNIATGGQDPNARVNFMLMRGSLVGTLNLDNFLEPAGYYEFLRTLNADLALNVPKLPPQNLADTATSEKIEYSIRLVNGILYINLRALQPLLNDPSLPAWGCYDIKPDLDRHIKELNARQQDRSPAAPLATGFDPRLVAQTMGAEVAHRYLTVTRTDDTSVGMATFETQLDLAGLYGDPTFREGFRDQAKNQTWQGWHITRITDEQFDHLQTVTAQIFPEPIVSNRFTIDLETGLLNSYSYWQPDEWIFTIQGALRGNDTSIWNITGVGIDVRLSHYNQISAITPPEGAQPFNVQILRKAENVWGVLPLASLVDETSETVSNC